MGLLFERPSVRPVVLTHEPALASWMRRDHPDQSRLEAFLTAVEEEGEPALARIAGDVAVELTIGLAPEEPLTRQRDLDNYLLPVVSRLGQRRITAAFARKVHAEQSTLAAAPAEYRIDDAEPMLQVRVVGSYEHPAWKEQIRAACEDSVGTGPALTGTAALDVSFVLSSMRNWTTLWKPTIDAVAGPLLGIPDPDLPWSPNDDHITRLGLHRTVDDGVGLDVVVRAWWRPDRT